MKVMIFLGILVMLVIVGCAPPPELPLNMTQVCFESKCVISEIVDTPETRAQGLMYREQMDPNKGMLFVFDRPAVYHFWMRNTLISLDMVFLNSNQQIIYIEKNAQPCIKPDCEKYGPMEEALYVVEVNAGFTDKHGVEIGETVSFSLPLEQ